MGDVMADALVFNGLNAATGAYLLDPLEPEVISRLAHGESLDPDDLAELKARFAASSGAYLGLIDGVDPTRLSESGWGVLFAHDADPAIREALEPLLALRRSQAAEGGEGRFRELTGPDGYRPGDTSRSYLVRHDIAPGSPVDPDKLPYYLMIVGDPETIPYRFQYQLDVTFAVGRISFDTPEEYAAYAEAVVAAEGREAPKRRAVFFGVQNADDRATQMSATLLVEPLAGRVADAHPDWSVQAVVGPDATKAGLAARLAEDPPSLLFTASHGVGLPPAHPSLVRRNGALVCGEWPGPVEWRRELPDDFTFSGDDLSASFDADGMVAFLFACYGAGTPQTDDFSLQALGRPATIAPHPFVAHLPKRLLLQGAQAVVGHVERAWSFSFAWPRVSEHLEVFQSTLSQVVRGIPVGAAVEFFNEHYAALTTELEAEKEDAQFGAVSDPLAVSGLWTARNDARNYVILGDPAVRVR